MFLTYEQKSLIERVLNVFETGTPTGKYYAIARYNDGPHQIRQITYGRSQTTEYGNLRQLISDYADANGTLSAELKPYVAKIGVVPLVEDETLMGLLKEAGRNDPVMKTVQDAFFDRVYFAPAMRWADENGFVLPLSGLIIYDSFIHSGQIFWFLRKRFTEVPPGQQGDERKWTKSYVEVRNQWLKDHTRADVRASAYRTRDLLAQVNAGNWYLSETPILANGVNVNPLPNPYPLAGP